MRGALKHRVKWLKGCAAAAFSNMEGADEKEFLYWQHWMNDCEAELAKDQAALAPRHQRGKEEEGENG